MPRYPRLLRRCFPPNSAEASSVEAGLSSTKLPAPAKTSESSRYLFYAGCGHGQADSREEVVRSRGDAGALKQIGRVNPRLMRLFTLVAEESLMAQAAAADESLAKGKLLGRCMDAGGGKICMRRRGFGLLLVRRCIASLCRI